MWASIGLSFLIGLCVCACYSHIARDLFSPRSVAEIIICMLLELLLLWPYILFKGLQERLVDPTVLHYRAERARKMREINTEYRMKLGYINATEVRPFPALYREW